MYVDPGFLGQSRTAVATMCRPGEIMTRDGCEPSGPLAEETFVSCPAGQAYDAPTDMCQPIPCPDGWVRAGDGTCQPEGQQYEPPEMPEPECPPGFHSTPQGCAADAPEPPEEPSSSGTGGAGLPALPPPQPPAQFAPTPAGPTTVTVEGPDQPEEGTGFGLLEVLVAGGLGILVSRAIRDR